jgi:RNA polymerase sigma-70 factor (ECF subfamily)
MTEPSITQGASAEEQEFRALFDTHFADVWRFARRRCASGADADDISAEVFAVAWRRRDDLPAGQDRLWLFGVARRVLANHRRTVNRQARLWGHLAQEAALSPADSWVQEADGNLREALDALSEEDRELLMMRAWDELSVRDMATLLGCSPNAVSLRLYKARRRLAAGLGRKETAAKGHVAVEPLEARKECHERS